MCCGCTSSVYIVFKVCLLNCVIALVVVVVELLLFAFCVCCVCTFPFVGSVYYVSALVWYCSCFVVDLLVLACVCVLCLYFLLFVSCVLILCLLCRWIALAFVGDVWLCVVFVCCVCTSYVCILRLMGV